MTKEDDTNTSIQSLDPELKTLLEDGALNDLLKNISSIPSSVNLSPSGGASGVSSPQIGVSLTEAKEYQKLFAAARDGFLTEPVEEATKERAAKEDDCTGTKGYVAFEAVPIIFPFDPIATLLYYLAAMARIYDRAKTQLDRALTCEKPCVPLYEIKSIITSRPYEMVTVQRDPVTGAISFSYVWTITIVLDVQKDCVREF